MPKRVATGRFRQPGQLDRRLERSLQHRFVQMVTSVHARRGIDVLTRGREHPLPPPLPRRARVPDRQRVGQNDAPRSCGDVTPVLRPHGRQLRLEAHAKRPWQHGMTVAPSLPIPHENLGPFEIQVLDAQRAALEQPKATAVHQRRHQPAHAGEVLKHRGHFLATQNNREACGALGTDQWVEVIEWRAEHLRVEKQ